MLNLLKLVAVFLFSLGMFSCGSDVNVNLNIAENAPSAAEGFDLEQFHKLLIEEGESAEQWDAQFLADLVNREDINNLDLNQNNLVDTILVEPFDGGETKGFQLYTKVVDNPGDDRDEEQTIATVTVAQEGETGSLTVSGNEQVYGAHHHYHSSGMSNFFLMYWLMSPRMMYGSAYNRGYTNNHGPRKTATTSQYKGKMASRNASHTGQKAPAASRPNTVAKSAATQKTAARGIKSKLNNPTSSQKSFRSQSQAKAKASSGFGKKSTGTSTNKSSGRSRVGGGK